MHLTMLRIEIPASEMFNERENRFENTSRTVLSIEHSLISLSKWESKWCVPFLSKRDKTYEEVLDYIICMTLTQNVSLDTYLRLTKADFEEIKAYIDAPMTATKIKKKFNSGSNSEIVTSELIYYWMTALNIPFECQKWHLNRLLTLINICNIKQESPKKMSNSALAKRNTALNAKRKASLGTKG